MSTAALCAPRVRHDNDVTTLTRGAYDYGPPVEDPVAAPTRTEYLQIRISAEAKDQLREAARASGQDLSTFVLQAANRAAQEVLAESWTFTLNDASFAGFVGQFDTPGRALPGLQALASEPSPFVDR